MSRENPLWGASRIHGELLMLGFEVAQSIVSKYMTCGRKSPSQCWKTFLRNHAEAIAAIDLCAVLTVTFDRLFAAYRHVFTARVREWGSIRLVRHGSLGSLSAKNSLFLPENSLIWHSKFPDPVRREFPCKPLQSHMHSI
jgi:hypothetical protein